MLNQNLFAYQISLQSNNSYVSEFLWFKVHKLQFLLHNPVSKLRTYQKHLEI